MGNLSFFPDGSCFSIRHRRSCDRFLTTRPGILTARQRFLSGCECFSFPSTQTLGFPDVLRPSPAPSARRATAGTQRYCSDAPGLPRSSLWATGMAPCRCQPQRRRRRTAGTTREGGRPLERREGGRGTRWVEGREGGSGVRRKKAAPTPVRVGAQQALSHERAKGHEYSTSSRNIYTEG